MQLATPTVSLVQSPFQMGLEMVFSQYGQQSRSNELFAFVQVMGEIPWLQSETIRPVADEGQTVVPGDSPQSMQDGRGLSGLDCLAHGERRQGGIGYAAPPA